MYVAIVEGIKGRVGGTCPHKIMNWKFWLKALFDCRGVWCNVFLYCLLTIVAEDNHGMLFNGSNVSSTHEVTSLAGHRMV